MKSKPPSFTIQRFSVTTQVVQELRRQIASGELAPETTLTEVGLAKMLGVSRVPVREAMIQLRNDGLVVLNERGHSVVQSFHEKDFNEILSLRLALEPVSANQAAAHRDDEDLRRIDENLNGFLASDDVDALAQFDVDFHGLIFRASKNSRLIHCWNGIRWQYLVILTQIYRNYAALVPHDLKGSEASHRRILDAIRDQDSELSTTLMREHVLDWKSWNPYRD